MHLGMWGTRGCVRMKTNVCAPQVYRVQTPWFSSPSGPLLRAAFPPHLRSQPSQPLPSPVRGIHARGSRSHWAQLREKRQSPGQYGGHRRHLYGGHSRASARILSVSSVVGCGAPSEACPASALDSGSPSLLGAFSPFSATSCRERHSGPLPAGLAWLGHVGLTLRSVWHHIGPKTWQM